MTNKLIDIYDRILEYDDNEVYIAFHDKTQEPYFHANQVAKLLEYKDYKQALKLNVQKRDMLQLKNIVKNYKSLYKNVQGHTKFLSEPGLYSLILRSKKDNAIKVFDWIVHDVMPSLKKYGKYELNEKDKKHIKKLHNKITNLKNKMAVLKHNLRSPIVPKGKVIYVLRLIEDDMKFSKIKIILLLKIKYKLLKLFLL
jgi:prophage antirepressor-like protein